MSISTKGLIMTSVYENATYDEERALYSVRNALIENCRFAGETDGESALKETFGLTINNCDFLLRYPLWHTTNTTVSSSKMTETCRAALWYDTNTVIRNSDLRGIKAVRECDNTEIYNTKINSNEFGWFCRNLSMNDCILISEYPFLHTTDMMLDNIRMQGKYSFQYVENAEIHNSVLDTKDAFWHGKNITLYDSVIKGEYLGWYSENLKFVRCKIIGTQPLCYAKNIVLEDCKMIDCDLAFENSSVTASINGNITSIKNPLSGRISADSIDDIITDQLSSNNSCKIVIKSK